MFTTKIICGVILFAASIQKNVRADCDDLDLEVFESGVSSEEISLILARHNGYRQAIMDGKIPAQPKGVNIKYLRWDENLARTAQEIADTCTFKHRRVLDDRWPDKVGQNLYRTEQDIFEPGCSNWTRAVEMWFLEHKLFRYGPIGFDYEKTGHYTQLIWDKTELVGCGYVSYENDRENMNEAAQLYVCHYGPPGNRFYKYPYQAVRGGGKRDFSEVL